MSDLIGNILDVHDEEHEHHADAWNKHRGRFSPRAVKIHGQSLGNWCAHLLAQDSDRIETAIQAGMSAGEDNMTIAHRVIGSAAFNGANGATEYTRQQLLRLGAGYLRKRKRHMGGTGQDVLPGQTETTDET